MFFLLQSCRRTENTKLRWVLPRVSGMGQVGPSTRDPSRYNPNALIKQMKGGGAGAKQQGTETHIQIVFMFLNHWLLDLLDHNVGTATTDIS